MSNNLDSDVVRPDLGPNCLQRLLAHTLTCIELTLTCWQVYIGPVTGPGRAVLNVSGYRWVSYCRSRVASLIPARSHTFVEIDHEIISTVILLPSSSAESFKKGCCQLQAKVSA